MRTFEYICQLPWMAPLGWTLIHFLWEGAVIGFGLWIVLRAMDRHAPNLRYQVACGALLAAVGAFVATFVLLSQPEAVAPHQERVTLQAWPQVITQPATDQPTSHAPNTRSQGTPANSESNQAREASRSPSAMVAMALNQAARWAVPLWFAGVLLLALRLCLAWCRVQIWRFKTAPLLDAAILDSCSRLAERLHVRQRVKVLLCQVTPGPVTLGWMRPVILLPVHIVTGLRPDEIEAILAHELAHIRRHDYLVNLLQSVIEVVLFYHPAIWWMSRQMRETREQCCDEMAARACENRLRVARALSSLAELEAAPQPAVAATQGSLLTRIARLLGRRPAEPLLSGRNAAWTLSLASIVLVALAILHSADLRAETSEEVANTKAAPRGIVLDENGTPSPKARVLVYHVADYWGLGNAVVEEVQTDEKGHFACTKPLQFAVPNGSVNTDHYLLFATQKRKGLEWTPIVGGTPEQREFTLRLSPPVSQRCKVIDETGKPVAGATLWLKSDVRRDGDFRLWSDAGVSHATTDESGMATVSDLPGEDCQLAASKPGYEDCLASKEDADGTPSFKLEPAGTLEGRVTDPLGKPVKGATVRLVPQFFLYHNFLARTDADGFYRVEKISSHGTLPDCGKYSAGIEHPQFTMAEREVAFKPGETITNFNLTVEPGTEIDGTLIDPNGNVGVAGGGILVDSKCGRQEVFSNARGEFHARVPAGEFVVMLASAPGGHYVVGNGRWIVRGLALGERVPLRCEIPGQLGKMGRVHGRAVDATGTPVAHAVINVLIPGPVPESSHGRTNRNNWVAWVTREDGRFEIAEVPIGLQVTIAGEEHATQHLAGLWTGTIKDADTDLGDSLVLQTTGTAEVQVVDLDGRPRRNLRLEVSANFEGQVFDTRNLTSDASGVLRVPGTTPGMKYQIQTSNFDIATTELLPPEATAGDRRTVAITDKYRIRVEGPDGHVVPINSFKEFHVWILDDNGERTRWTNGPLKIAERQGEDVVVPRKTLWQGASGDRIELVVETKDGKLVNAEGVLPDATSGLIVAKSKEPPRAPDAAPDASIRDVTPDEIAGRVVDADGKPVAGTTVTLEGGRYGVEPPVFTADTNGVFRIPSAGSRRNSFTSATIFHEGFAPVFVTDLPQGRGSRITLQNSTRLQGVIGGDHPGKVALTFMKDKSTRQAAFGYVVHDITYQQTTEANGAYDFPMEPGTYRYTAISEDGRFARGEVTVADGRKTAIPAVLQRGGDVEFHLVDWQTGKPLAGIEISILDQLQYGAQGPREGSTRTSDEKGIVRWKNVMPGETQFDAPRMAWPTPGVEQHRYVRWWRENEPVKSRRVDPTKLGSWGQDGMDPIVVDVAREMKPIQVLLEQGARISGTVVGPDGAPAKDVSVGVVPNNGNGTLTGDSRFIVQADEQGQFHEYIPAGHDVSYHLCAYSAPKKDVSAAAASVVSESFFAKPGEELTFRLQMSKGAWITGRVTNAPGKAASKIKVSALPVDQLDLAYANRVVTPDGGGNFKLGPLRAGKYEVVVGTGATVPVQQLPGMESKRAEVGDAEVKDIGGLALPSGGWEE